MTDPAPLPVNPRFYCAEHGPTNEVLGLFGASRCLRCLEDLLDHAEQGVRLAQAYDIQKIAMEAQP